MRYLHNITFNAYINAQCERHFKHVQLQFWMLSPLCYVNWWLNAPHNAYIKLNVNDALHTGITRMIRNFKYFIVSTSAPGVLLEQNDQYRIQP